VPWLTQSAAIYAFLLDVLVTINGADPGDRAVSGVGLGPLACWDCGFDSCRGHGCLSVVSVVCCEVEEVSVKDRSLVQRSSTECDVCNLV